MRYDRKYKMLNRMLVEGIFKIKEISDEAERNLPDDCKGKDFRITECCDIYFSDYLTRDELRKLGEELIELSYEDA